MELDKGFEFAVILAWKDLMPGDQLMSARVEYESKRGVPLDCMSVWTVRSWGYQDRVCDYWTAVSPAHPIGVHFSNGYHSEALTKALDFIMKNQDQFTSPADAWRSHLVLIQPPPADLVVEAATWMTGVQATAPNQAGSSEAKAGRQPIPRNGVKSRAASSARIPTNGSRESAKSVDRGSGFPNGPWCR